MAINTAYQLATDFSADSMLQIRNHAETAKHILWEEYQRRRDELTVAGIIEYRDEIANYRKIVEGIDGVLKYHEK